MTKAERIDLGLALMALSARRGQCRSQVEIAAYCGCSRSAICQIEQRALKKLRHPQRAKILLNAVQGVR